MLSVRSRRLFVAVTLAGTLGLAACGSDSSSETPGNAPASTDKMTESTGAMTESTDTMTESTDAMTESTDKMTESTDKMTASTDAMMEESSTTP